MKKFSLLVFGLASIGEIMSNLAALPVVHTICKPALLLTLAVYYAYSQRDQKQPLSAVLIIALFFSWAGDVLLMVPGELFFMLGLGSFLAAHAFYIFTFRQHRLDDDPGALHGLHKARFAFPIVLYGCGLIVVLYDRLGDLKMPVIAYAIALTLMVLNALFRFRRTSAASFMMVFGGAILFMISDSLLAVNKFLQPITLSGFWIMTTYIGAQFLIVKGLTLHGSN